MTTVVDPEWRAKCAISATQPLLRKTILNQLRVLQTAYSSRMVPFDRRLYRLRKFRVLGLLFRVKP